MFSIEAGCCTAKWLSGYILELESWCFSLEVAETRNLENDLRRLILDCFGRS
jgi:hypothetical protein